MTFVVEQVELGGGSTICLCSSWHGRRAKIVIGGCCVSCFSTSLAADDGQIQLRPLQPINTKGPPPSSPIKAGDAVRSEAAS